MEPECLRYVLKGLQHRRVGRLGRIPQDGYAGQCGYGLLEQFQPFPVQVTAGTR